MSEDIVKYMQQREQEMWEWNNVTITLPPAGPPEKCLVCKQWFRHTQTFMRHAVAGHHHCEQCGDYETPTPGFWYRTKRWLKIVFKPEQW